MSNLSAIWNELTKANQEISELYHTYRDTVKQRLNNVLPGRRSVFFTATEFEFPWVLTNTANDQFSILPTKNPVTKPIVASNDGILSISRMSYEAYLEFSFTYTNGLSVQQRSRRTTMNHTPFGLSHYMVINPNMAMPAPNTVTACPAFDFEWKLAIGSNDRSYATDAIVNNNQNAQGMLARKCLGGYNEKQLQFLRPYFLDGNEFYTLTINPTLVPLSNFRFKIGTNTGALPAGALTGVSNVSAKVIISVVTIGHKILGNGHRV